jgi:glycosyltransferase involved in cell wall biosynthesis
LDVAVIIPAFNAGPYLDQTLASVAGQTYLPAQVVVADDCSGDDTVERVRGWASRLPVEVLRLERNSGPGPARDRAIQVTNTSLLAILDADDLLLPDHLETMVAAHEHAHGLVSAQELPWAPGRGVDLARRRNRPAPIPTEPAEQLVALLQRNYINFPVFSRVLYQATGGFRARFRVGEDWDLWIRMLRAGARITETSHPTALHRVRLRSLSVDPRSTVESGIAVLTVALAESRSALERDAAERGLQALHARKRYHDASALAAGGHPWRARAVAVRRGRGGGWRVTAGLTALAVAPRTSIHLERATRRYRTFRPE